jgi:hypothetical protein
MELTSLARRMATGSLMAIASLAAALSGAAAQETGPATECAAGGGAAYQRCALWMDGRRVRRGVDGAVVAEPGFFSPLRLTRVVQGDSAVAQAARFERNTTAAGVFGVLSAASLAGALILADRYECRPDPFLGACTTSDDAFTAGVLAFAVGGVVTGIISGILQHRAGRAASRAIFWHNSNFAR